MESSPQIRAKGADSGLLPLAHATSTCQFPPPGSRTPLPDWMSVSPHILPTMVLSHWREDGGHQVGHKSAHSESL